MSMKSPIYLAGHSGLIGSAFFRRFKKEGVTPLTKIHSDLDLSDGNKVQEYFEREKPQTVILAAGKTGGIADNQKFSADYISQNLAIQSNVFQAAKAVDVDKVLFFGSSCMYPRDCTQPMREDQLLTGKPEPTSISTAIAKLAGIYACLAFNQQYMKESFIPVIPNNVYGPGDNFDYQTSHVLAALVRRFHEAKEKEVSKVVLWGTGKPRREFIYVEDLVDACFHLMMGDRVDCELPVNISSGQDYSIMELAGIVSSIVGYKGGIEWDLSQPDGAPKKILDCDRLYKQGWKPKIDIERGIRSTYDWYLAHEVVV